MARAAVREYVRFAVGAEELLARTITAEETASMDEESDLVWVDTLRPHMLVASGSGVHAYWRLERNLEASEIESLNRRLVAHLRGDLRVCFERGRDVASYIIATLVFGGLRMEELCDLRWRDVDLAAGRLRVGDSKTEAGRRHVELLEPLRKALTTHKADASSGRATGYVFATRDGTRPSKNNVRARVFNAAVKRANEDLERDDQVPLPDGLTPHKLRHMFASLLVALGEDPVHVMGQLGHTDPAFSLRIYAHAMRRGGSEKARLRALVEGTDWA